LFLGSCDAKRENWDVNSPQNFENDYIGYIKNILDINPKPKVYIVLPPPILPCAERGRNKGELHSEVVNDYMPKALKKISEEEDVELIDLFHYIGGGNEDR